MMAQHPYLILREDAAPTVDGRTIVARVCTYGRVYTPAPGERERVAAGAFRAPLARPAGVLRYRHNGERPGDRDSLGDVHGLVTALREENGGVVAEVEVFPGPDGDKLLRLAAGPVRGVSMAAIVAGARTVHDAAGQLTEITRISHLDGVSLTPANAYDDARVLALREADTAAIARERAENAAMRAYLAALGYPDRAR